MGFFLLLLKLFWHIDLYADIPKTDFYPVPKVDGRVLGFQFKEIEKILSKDLFLKFVKKCFSFKRKMLFKQIEACSPEEAKKLLRNLNLNENCRAEELSPDQFVKLYIQKNNNK